MLNQTETGIKEMFQTLAASMEQLSTLRDRNVELERQSSEDIQTIEQLADAKVGLESLITDLRSQLDQANSQAARLRSDLYQVQAANVEKDREIADLRNANAAANNQLNVIDSDLTWYKNALAHTSANLAERNAQIEKIYGVFGLAPPAPQVSEPVAEPKVMVQESASEVAAPVPFGQPLQRTEVTSSPMPSNVPTNEQDEERLTYYNFGG